MRRLLHVMHYKPSGKRSFDHFIIRQAQEMSRRGWATTFVFEEAPPAEFGRALANAQADFVTAPFPFSWRSLGHLKKVVKGVQYDLVLTSFLSPFCLPLLGWKILRYSRRLVMIDHTSGSVPARRGWKLALTRMRGYLAGSVLDGLIPVSHSVARRDIEDVYLPRKKVRVVPNGIRIDLFPQVDRIPGDVVHIAYAGQLIKEKGVATLIRAFAQVSRSSSRGLKLSIAGTGPQRTELEKLVTELKLSNVEFLGHIHHVPALFAAADIVVVPSEWAEAFGLTIAEAMACKAACIVSDAGACPEVIGDTGLVFQAGNSQDLAEKLDALIVDERKRAELGKAARARVETCFDIDRQIAEIANICEAVVNGNKHLISGRDS